MNNFRKSSTFFRKLKIFKKLKKSFKTYYSHSKMNILLFQKNLKFQIPRFFQATQWCWKRCMVAVEKECVSLGTKRNSTKSSLPPGRKPWNHSETTRCSSRSSLRSRDMWKCKYSEITMETMFICGKETVLCREDIRKSSRKHRRRIWVSVYFILIQNLPLASRKA